MSRSVKVFLYGWYTGLLVEDRYGYTFEYDDNYNGPPLSISLPVVKQKYHSKELHPFFRSLAPEGWLLKQYSKHQKIDERDTFQMLCHNGKDMIGAVTFEL